MRRGAALVLVLAAACAGGAAGDPADDPGDLIVISHSPGNGDQVDTADSLDGFNALNNPTLVNPGAVTVVFSTSLDLASVLNPDPSDPQGTRNVRLFRFDTDQGPYDPQQPDEPGVNPPGGNVVVPATTVVTATRVPDDTVIIRPQGATPATPLPEGQYSVIVSRNVRSASREGLRGAEYFFFFRVGPDHLGPVVIGSSPAAGEGDVAPDARIRITMSETVLAASVNTTTISVSFQPAGTVSPIRIAGSWFTDGGNAPGNNVPAAQLDHAGVAGRSGVSPRNGVDLVFRPDMTSLPLNARIEDLLDPDCTLVGRPPRLGNRGLPLGQAITVSLEGVGIGITDTAGNPLPAGSPNATFTFVTRAAPLPIYAPGTRSAVYFGDTIGIGVIDADPTFWPYSSGPNPARERNTVVTTGAGPTRTVVRVPVPDLVDVKVDTRPYSAFYTPACSGVPSLYFPMVYALSRTAGGGEVLVIDSSRMVPVGRFATPAPGGLCVTARLGQGRLVVTNASANTATVYDVGRVSWLDLTNGPLQTQAGALALGGPLLLDEADFLRMFPNQRAATTSPPGPPIFGTVITGIGPSACDITHLPGAWGGIATFSTSPILAVINAGATTIDFTELLNLSQSSAVPADRPGVSLGSAGTDLEWTPVVPLFGTGRYFCYIATAGGTVDLFITGGGTSGRPSVGPNSSRNFAPNAITNSLAGFAGPVALQYAPNGIGIPVAGAGLSATVLVAESAAGRIAQVGVTQQFPGNIMQRVGEHGAGPFPIDLTGAPRGVFLSGPTGFFNYYVASVGTGVVREGSYVQAMIPEDIPTPGAFIVASWWSQ